MDRAFLLIPVICVTLLAGCMRERVPARCASVASSPAPAVADVTVTLAPPEQRGVQSHEIAARVRAALEPLYGPDGATRLALARHVVDLFDRTPGVVDANWYAQEAQPRLELDVDREKGAPAGVSAKQVVSLLAAAGERLLELRVAGVEGRMVPLSGLVRARGHVSAQPDSTGVPAIKRDGEWQITYEVFHDLGLAFALVGIHPAHALTGWFFTATSMIGFIAGAGIVVRNSIILVDFIELRRREGMSLDRAVVDAGAVRFRPMLLTESAVVAGSAVILFDPIFQGLALSLMAGEVASTLLSRMVVPVQYYLVARRNLKENNHADRP